MKIYVAGASSEIDRAEKWMNACREAGIEVVSTWPKVIREVGSANPMEASREDRAMWAAVDLGEVAHSSVFWLLLPESTTIGAWIEYGYALFLGAAAEEARNLGVPNAPVFRILTSSKEKSIFTALVPNFTTDEEAFASLKAMLGFERMIQKTKSPEASLGARLDDPSSDGG
jgi:hypothetical protein